MTATGDRLLTPSKITAWLDCEHYLTLRRAADAGRIPEPSSKTGSFARLLMDKGLIHERAYLGQLRAAGRTVFEVPARHHRETFGAWTARIGGVLTAGHDVVYQMPMIHGGLRGVADFLVRIDEPSMLGEFSYEPVDAKLARLTAKPGHVLQLCFYADALTELQGRPPDRVHLHLGSGLTESIRLADVHAYWRRIRRQLSIVMEAPESADTKPEPCAHCAFCEFADVCDAQWRSDDALHFVAGIRTSERDDLRAVGVTTLAALATSTEPVVDVRIDRLSDLRRQAALQHRARMTSPPPPFEPVAAADVAQRDRLPPPDDHDVFIDYEGHPFWTPSEGLFFLFGLLTRGTDGRWVYAARWAHDKAGEAAQTKALIDWLAERSIEHRGMHVFHYNHTERSALQRLAAEHGADEEVLETLVANGLFVDVLDVVKRAVVVGVESYGLKSVESVTGFERSHAIDRGAGAVVEYEAWSSDRDGERLSRIALYNEDDVRATLAVRDWLLAEPLAGAPWRPVVEPEEIEAAADDLVARLMATGESSKILLAHLLEYWNREGRAHRAQHLALLAAEGAEQLADPEVVHGLTFNRFVDPTGRQRDSRVVFRFPDQELGPDLTEPDGTFLMYPDGSDGVVSVSIDAIDQGSNELTVAWNSKAVEAGVMPPAMVVNDWVNTKPKPEALSEFASHILGEPDGGETNRTSFALLRRDPPRFTPGHGPPGGRFSGVLEEILEWAPHLDGSYVAIQGPPGTGKTYTGAHIIHHLVANGQPVGITAFSHNAIDNLIHEVQGAWELVPLRVLRQRARPRNPARVLPNATYNANRTKWDSGNHDVIAGTPWLFARPDMRTTPAVDVLVIDEAGQMGLADALAAMSSATNVILLGDPLQLAQVSIAAHPGGAGASVLEHILGDAATMPPDHGVFLDTTRRMHPDVCTFISEQIYEGRLNADPSCATQSVGGKAGLRWLRADHEGRSTSSPEEAGLVAHSIRSLLGRTWTDANGQQRPLGAADVMVVAPYNDQVKLVRATLQADPALADVRVGTVDKFQGQEAPVVYFTMATSSSADIPRTSEFLFSKNRLNVAISRARALAFVVCTDTLLDARARDVNEMKLIAALCAFVESATNPKAEAVVG